MSDWTIRTVERDGTLIANLPKAHCEFVEDELGRGMRARIAWPVHAYSTAEVNSFMDVQIYRNGDIRFWGILDDVEGDGGDGGFSANAHDYLQEFSYLNVDMPRVNELENGDFEEGDFTNFDTFPALDADIVTNPVVRGDFALHLFNPDPWTDRYAVFDDFVITSGAIEGRQLNLAGYIRFQQQLELETASYKQRGLYWRIRDEDDNFIASDWAPIDETLEPHRWHRLGPLRWDIAPGGITRKFQVRLYAPAVDVIWDEISITRPRPLIDTAIGTPLEAEADVARILKRGVQQIQNPANGKTDLGVGVSAPDTGVLAYKKVRRYEHLSFDALRNEYESRDDGVETWVGITPTTRTFFVRAQRGQDLEGVVHLQFGEGTDKSIAELGNFTKQASDVRTGVTVTADGSGPDQEEATFSDTSFSNGLLREDVFRAVQRSNLKTIDRQARGRLRASRQPALTFDIIPTDPAMDSTLGLGDIFDMTVNYGWLQVAEEPFRIIKKRISPVNERPVFTVHQAFAALVVS